MAFRSLDIALRIFVIVGVLSAFTEAASSITCTYSDCSRFECRCPEGSNASCPSLGGSLEADFNAGKADCLAKKCICGEGPSEGAETGEPKKTPDPQAGQDSGKTGAVVPAPEPKPSSEESAPKEAPKSAPKETTEPAPAQTPETSSKSDTEATPESSSEEASPEESDEDDDEPCIDAELLKALPKRSYWIKSSNAKMLCPADLPCVTPQHYFSDSDGKYVTARELCAAHAGCTTKWGPVGAVVVDGVKKLESLGEKTDGSFAGKNYVLTPWAENDGLRGCQACMRMADSVIRGSGVASRVAVSTVAGVQGFVMAVVSEFRVSVAIALVLSALSALSV